MSSLNGIGGGPAPARATMAPQNAVEDQRVSNRSFYLNDYAPET